MTRAVRLLATLLLLVLIAGLRAKDPTILQEMRWRVFDNYQRLAPREYKQTPVVVVDIDDETLQRHGQWPWPRTLVAELVRRLQDAGAAVVALDIIFSEPDRTSPANLLRYWQGTALAKRLVGLDADGTLPDHDKVLGEILARGNSVTGFFMTNYDTGVTPKSTSGIAVGGDPAEQFVPNFDGALVSVPAIEQGATGNGSFNVMADSDGVVRRVPMFVTLGDKLYPSFAAETLRTALGASTYIVKTSGGSGEMAFGEHTGVVKVKIGPYVIPTDGQGRVLLRDTGPVAERIFPVWEIFEPNFNPERVAGFIAIIGTTAAGLKDQHSTPLGVNTAGATVHAQLLEQALHEEYMSRPDWADGAEIVLLIALGLTVIVLFEIPKLGAIAPAMVSGVVIAGAFWWSWYQFTTNAQLFDPVYPGIAGVMIYTGASFIRYLATEGERRRVRSAFGRYLAPAMVERLAEDPERLTLGGEMRDLTLLFCDIRGFTSISEKLDPVELTNLINRFLTPMTEIIVDRGGTIDKYMGDCIMAFWNAPIDDPIHRAHAIESATAMSARLVTLNRELAREAEEAGEDPIHLGIGIGLNSGMCCVGNFGSDLRFDYSALGDDVNLASRLEGQSKTYGVELVLSEATLSEDTTSPRLELDLIVVKGRNEPVRIFTVLDNRDGARGEAQQRLMEAHAKMLGCYRGQDWDGVFTHAADARQQAELAEHDIEGLYDLYEERAEAFETEPPPADWDGVYTAETK